MRRSLLMFFLLAVVFVEAYVVVDVDYGPEISLRDPAKPAILWEIGGRVYFDLWKILEAGGDLGLSIDLESRSQVLYGGFSLRITPLESVPVFIAFKGLIGYPISYAFSADVGVDFRLNELVSIRVNGYFQTDFSDFDWGVGLKVISSSYSRKPECRDVPPGTLKLEETVANVELKCHGAISGSESMVVSKRWLESVLRGLRVDISDGTVVMGGKSGVKLKALKVRYSGKEIFLEDGKVPREARPSDPDAVIEISGDTFEVRGYPEIFEGLAPRNVKFQAYRLVYGVEMVYVMEGDGEKLRGYGCGGMRECEVDSYDPDEGVLVCDGQVIPASFVNLDVKVRDEVEKWIRGDDKASLKIEDVFEKLPDVPLDVTVNGVPIEAFKASETETLDLVLKPSSDVGYCVLSPEGGVEKRLRIVVERLPNEVTLPKGACVMADFKGKLKVVGDDGREYEAEVLRVGKDSVEVEIHGYTYTIRDVKVIDVGEIPRHLEVGLVATDEGAVEIEGRVPVNSLVASGESLRAEYSSGKWKIEGDLKKAGRYSLEFRKVVIGGCEIPISGTVTVEVKPDYESAIAKVKGELYSDEGGSVSVDIRDKFGNAISVEKLILKSSRASLTVVNGRIPKGAKAGKYTEAHIVLEGKEMKVEEDVDVVVMPGYISKDSGFLVEGRVYRKVGKTPGKHWVSLKLVDEYGNDLSEFVEEMKYTLEKKRNSVVVLKDGTPFLEISGVEDYSPDRGEVLLGEGNVEVTYRDKKEVFEVLSVSEKGAELNMERVFGGVMVSVSGGMCKLIIGEGESRVEKTVRGRAVVPVPGFDSVKVLYSCYPDLGVPVIGRVEEMIEEELPPVSLDFRRIVVIREVPKLSEKSIAVFPTVSPGGEYIAYTVRNLESGETAFLVESRRDGKVVSVFKGAVSGAVWSADGYLVFSGSTGGDYKLYSFDPTSGKLSLLYEVAGKNVINPAFDFSGVRLAFIVEKEGILVGKFSKGVFKLEAKGPKGVTVGVSPDGRLAYSRDREAYIWDGKEEKRIDSDDSVELDFSWSPDGKWLVYYKKKKEKGNVVLVGYNSSEGMEYILVDGVRREFGRVLWLGNDRFLFGAVGDEELAIYSLKDMKVLHSVGISFKVGEVVSTGSYSIFPASDGIHVVFGGYLIASTGGQRDTVLEGLAE